MKWKMLSLFIAAGLLVLLVAFVSSKKGTNQDFEAAKEVIMMRKIAHEVLRYTGDSTSRVMPVKTISASEFQVPFESRFSFKPDSLVKIIDRVISTSKPGVNYIVNVLDCNTDKLIFGYAILKSEEKNILPCMGRDQPSTHYCIDVKFENKRFSATYLYVTVIGFLSIALLFFGIQRFRKKDVIKPAFTEENSPAAPADAVAIGQYLFYPKQQTLVLNGENAVLTGKESKLLQLFAATPNQIIDRNNLQKIWEDEGVIVGRSLDMFVSKLRKKLENDPAVKLVNIHGKGYKLEIIEHAV